MMASSSCAGEDVDHISRIKVALDQIEGNLRDEITAEALARTVHLSPSHLRHVFARVTGCTLAEYVRRRRLAWAALDLALSRKRILDIAVEYRFSSQEAFTRAFQRRYGAAPGAFRRRHEYAQAMSRLGVYRSEPVIMEISHMEANDQGIPSAAQDRRVLDGVMRVGFYRGGDQCPEDIPFPSCLAAYVRYMGDEYPWLPLHAHNMEWRLNYANVHILGASGMAFGLLWREGWHMDNTDMMFVADPREVIERAFAAVGHPYEIVHKTGAPEDEALYRARILDSIDAGRPALAFGVIGPPECCLITGYDEGGDVLIGWNYFQDDPEFNAGVAFEPGGCFRKRHWCADTHSLIIVGERQADHDPWRGDREALRWALHVARTPEVLGRHAGFAAYAAWAAQISDDAALDTDDVDVLRQRHEVHNSAVGTLAECRAWASSYLRQMAERHPAMAPDLHHAADGYMAQHDLMWEAWGLVGGNGHPEAYIRFAEPAVRRGLAEILHRCQALDR
jgi:AraC-like DNA-binding protein